MGYIRIQLIRYIFLFVIATIADARATVIAVVAADVILVSTALAAIGQLSARHGNKGTVAAFNDFQVANDKAVVKRNRAEGT